MSMSDEDKAAFVMEFVGASENFRSQYVERWIETLENFTMSSASGGIPRSSSGSLSNLAMDAIFLKDPETHKVIMTYASKLVRAVLGSPEGDYIQAAPVGWEDAVKAAPTVSRLMRYAFSIPGHFRTMVEAIIDMLLFGTGIVEVGWWHEERMMPVRSAWTEGGLTMTSQSGVMSLPIHDDVDLTVVDVQNFYPDPGEYRIERMKGAAKKFTMSANQARLNVKNGIYKKSAVDLLGSSGGTSAGNPTANSTFREALDQPTQRERPKSFREFVGYTYMGECPWIEDDGASRRMLVVLDGQLVQDVPWPLADSELPWKTLVINPTVGRFYGTAPAEVIRYDQDFADVLKELIARAVIRQVHPPIAFDPEADIDVALLRKWRTDMPIAARGGPASIGTLQYNANILGAMNMLQLEKLSMQEASGAQGGIQGEPGPNRESATVGTLRVQNAMDRPELAAMMLERDCFPQIGKAILRRYQQYLESEDDLRRRIGELPEQLWLGDILADFDIRFVGSRMAQTRQQKLVGLQTLGALAAQSPALAMQIPWDKLARWITGDLLELPDVAAQMPDPNTVMQNMAAMQAQQLLSGGEGGPAQNGVPASPSTPGLMPAQAAGGPLGTS